MNADGRRFSDETRGYSEQATVVLAQPGDIAWTVFDGRIAGIARQFEDFRQAEAAGAVLSAQNPSELARQAGLPAEALVATVDAVDRMKRFGLTDGFGRCFAGVPELQAPLHAVRVTGALFHTQGGLVVDRSGRVLRDDGRPLPSLFAAGGAACGVSGATAAGYLSGNGLLTAITLGRLSGAAAAHLAAGRAHGSA